MTLAELVARLTSSRAYQEGRADETDVVAFSFEPLETGPHAIDHSCATIDVYGGPNNRLIVLVLD